MFSGKTHPALSEFFDPLPWGQGAFFTTPDPATLAPGAARTWGPGSAGYQTGTGYPGSVGFLLLPESLGALAGVARDPVAAVGGVIEATGGGGGGFTIGTSQELTPEQAEAYRSASQQAADLLAETLSAASSTLEYISNLPGEVGEAGGEFVAGLGAGVGAASESVIGGVTAPLSALPGDLFEGVPTWVPLLGAAYLLTR